MAQILNKSSRSGRKKRQTNFIQIKQHKPKRSSERPPRDGLPVLTMADQKGKDMRYFVDGKEISKEEADKIKKDNQKYMESNDLNQWEKIKFIVKIA